MNPSCVDITIIIPAFNSREHIIQAIESALRQVPPFRQLIVVDDGSADNTPDLVERTFGQQVECYRQTHMGPGAARNLGLQYCKSRFVYFMDSDDLIAPGLTFSFSEALRERSNIDAYLFSATAFNVSHGKESRLNSYYSRAFPGRYSAGKIYLEATTQNQSFIASPCLYIFRASIARQTPPLSFGEHYHEDEVFTPSILERCGAIEVTNTAYYQRRVRNGSIMQGSSSLSNVLGYLVAAEWWHDYSTRAGRKGRNFPLLRSYSMYSLAVLHAARMNLSTSEFFHHVRSHAPVFKDSARHDYLLSRVSRKLAAAIIRCKGALLARKS